MNRSRVIFVLSAVLVLIWCYDVRTESAQESDIAKRFLSIGTVGPHAINLSVWTNKPQGEPFKGGDRVIIYFRADKDCYVTGLNVSDKGDITILFPSNEDFDNSIQAGKQYSLFGDSSAFRLEIGKGVNDVKAVFYVSSGTMPISNLIPEDSSLLKIPHSDSDQLDTLYNIIEAASHETGFNRVILSLTAETEKKSDLKLMGPSKGARPSLSDSERPDSLTGAQGSKSEKNQK